MQGVGTSPFFIFSLTRPEEASTVIQIPVPGVEVAGIAGPAKFNGEWLGPPLCRPVRPPLFVAPPRRLLDKPIAAPDGVPKTLISALSSGNFVISSERSKQRGAPAHSKVCCPDGDRFHRCYRMMMMILPPVTARRSAKEAKLPVRGRGAPEVTGHPSRLSTDPR